MKNKNEELEKLKRQPTLKIVYKGQSTEFADWEAQVIREIITAYLKWVASFKKLRKYPHLQCGEGLMKNVLGAIPQADWAKEALEGRNESG